MTATDVNTLLAINGVLSVWITQLPSSGALYQTSDGVTLGAQITTTPSLVTNSNFSVVYVNTAATAPFGGISVLYTDTILWQPRLTYNATAITSSVSMPQNHHPQTASDSQVVHSLACCPCRVC